MYCRVISLKTVGVSDDFCQRAGNNPSQQREKDAGNYSNGEESRAQNRELVKMIPPPQRAHEVMYVVTV